MHEILDTSNQYSRMSKNSPLYLDSDLNIEGKMIFHRFHKKKWKMYIDSSKTKIFRMRRTQTGGVIPTNIQLGANQKIRIEAIDCLGCKIKNSDISEGKNNGINTFVKKDEFR